MINEVYSKLQDRIIFEPHVITYSTMIDELKLKDCISDGLYCTFT